MAVKLLKKVQESVGYNDYQMSKALGISQSNYVYLVDEAQSIRIDVLVKAWRLSKLSGREFLELIEVEAEKIEPKRRGRVAKKY